MVFVVIVGLEVVVLLLFNWVSARRPYMSSNKALHHTIQAREVYHDCQTNSAATPLLKSGHLTPQTSTTLIIRCGRQLNEREAKPFVTPKRRWLWQLEARIMAAFSNLDKETVQKKYRRFWSCLEMVEDKEVNELWSGWSQWRILLIKNVTL